MVGEFVCMYGWMDGWMDGCMYVCMCMYVHVQVCHFGCLLTICVLGVRGSLQYM